MYHKIQDPISNSIFKTKSADGKQLVQKYQFTLHHFNDPYFVIFHHICEVFIG